MSVAHPSHITGPVADTFKGLICGNCGEDGTMPLRQPCRSILAPRHGGKLLPSDELHFLRWHYGRMASGEQGILDTYEITTGRAAPRDYRSE